MNLILTDIVILFTNSHNQMRRVRLGDLITLKRQRPKAGPGKIIATLVAAGEGGQFRPLW